MQRRYVRLAQLDRAFGYGPKGREFESSSARDENPVNLRIYGVFGFRKRRGRVISFIIKRIQWKESWKAPYLKWKATLLPGVAFCCFREDNK